MYIYDNDGVLKSRALAELVALAFIGSPPDNHYILDYIDQDVNGDVQRLCETKNKSRAAGRRVKPVTREYGHQNVSVYVNNKYRSIGVHCFVALAFISSQPSPAHEVAHNDGNPRNNHYLNLRWDTHIGNMADTILHGTRLKGERHAPKQAKCVDIFEIRQALLDYKKYSRDLYHLAEKYNVAYSTIVSILKNPLR